MSSMFSLGNYELALNNVCIIKSLSNYTEMHWEFSSIEMPQKPCPKLKLAVCLHTKSLQMAAAIANQTYQTKM